MTSSRIACDQNRPPREPRRRPQTHAVPTTKLAVQVQISQQRTANIQEPFDSSEFPRPAWLPRSTRATTPSSSTPAAGVALPSPPEEPVVILHPYLPTEEAMNGTAPRQGRSRAKHRRATLPVPPGNDSHSWWISWRGPASDNDAQLRASVAGTGRWRGCVPSRKIARQMPKPLGRLITSSRRRTGTIPIQPQGFSC